MCLRAAISTLVVCLFTAGLACAQQDITIQQPVFNFSTVNTTVSVPDGGTGLLGGVSRAAEGSSYRGVPMLSKIPGLNRLFQNRSIGREMSASNMSVIPRIIILEEEELRQTGVSSDTLSMHGGGSMGGQAGGQFGGRAPAGDPVARKAAFLTSNIARHELDSPRYESAQEMPSVAEVRRENEAAATQRTAEASAFFVKAEQAKSEGKVGVAKIYYKMAARRAEGDLLQQIADTLAMLENPQPAGPFSDR